MLYNDKHEIDEDIHAECVDLAKDLLEHLENNDYPTHQIDLVRGIVGELTEDYSEEKEKDSLEDLEDEELEDLHYKSLKKK